MEGQLIRAWTKFEIVTGRDGDLVRVTVPGVDHPFFFTVDLVEMQLAEIAAMVAEYRAGRGTITPI